MANKYCAGQIWRHIADRCRVEVMEVTNQLRAKILPLGAGEKYPGRDWVVDDTRDFWKHRFDLLWDLEESSDANYGITCASCGEYYKYAEHRTNFKCWSCRNKY